MVDEKITSQDEQENPEKNKGASEQGKSSNDNASLKADLSNILNSDLNIAGGDITIDNKVIYVHVNADIEREIRNRAIKEAQDLQRTKPPEADENLQGKISEWFETGLINEQERLFVVTLSMFSGLKYSELIEIYQTILGLFTDKDATAKKGSAIDGLSRTPFRTDDELQNKAGALIKRDQKGLEELVLFKIPEYEDAIFKLLRQQYRSLLFKLLPAMKQIGERFDREVRSRAAEAVAEIGKLGFQKMRLDVLEEWARDKRSYVRATVGYTLARLYADGTTRIGAQDLLEDWSELNHGNPDSRWRVRWTTASSYKQIGFDHPDVAYIGLKRVARYNDIRVADSIIHTFVVLSLQKDQLAPIIRTLGQWAEEGTGGRGSDQDREIICRVALLAFIVLSQIHTEIVEEEIDSDSERFTARAGDLLALISTSRFGNDSLWQVVVSMGIRAFENDLKDAFFDLIEGWVKQATKRKKDNDTLIELLADVFGQSRAKYRETIFNRLTRWEKRKGDDDKALSQFASLAKAEIRKRYG